MKEALDQLRGQLNGERIDFGELVILGARHKLRRLRSESEEATSLRRDLADRIRTRGDLGMDVEAADEVKRTGWARPL